ncbi:MAG: tryptophan synthase subunit alpha [Candidatus Microthrix sp.]|nr:tryptophan synthase subunit alpha [Candidatus Microthrix sp.]MBK6439573.1 tryptophan synthase subunit alpha [Candidatus Microthrix sp.]
MDGPTIQAASDLALHQGPSPRSIEAAGAADVGIPLAVMTYYNLVFRPGVTRFAGLARAGIAGHPARSASRRGGPWIDAADTSGVETVLLAAPTTPDERLDRIAQRSRGLLMPSGCSASPASGPPGRFGQGDRPAPKDITDLPRAGRGQRLQPPQAVEVCEVADGAVVRSTFMRKILDGASPIRWPTRWEFRGALDRGCDIRTLAAAA